MSQLRAMFGCWLVNLYLDLYSAKYDNISNTWSLICILTKYFIICYFMNPYLVNDVQGAECLKTYSAEIYGAIL